MRSSFNSKIFGVALIPLYGYLLISLYVLVNSGFRFDVFNPISVVVLIAGMLASAFCYSYRGKMIHVLGLLIMLALGGFGIYVGLIVEPMNWMELIASAFLIAFGLAFYEMVEHHREVWHENN